MKTTGIIALLASLYILLHACGAESRDSVKKAQFFTKGHSIYTRHCQNCHGAKGEGLALLYPPLTDERWLLEHRARLPSIVKHGMKGEITIDGRQYDQEMPGVSELTPQEIAYVLTYITNAFGNKSTIYSTEEVEENLKTKP